MGIKIIRGKIKERRKRIKTERRKRKKKS